MTVPITSCNPPPRRCAECLGILGAVDPARVTVLMPLPEPLCEFRRDGTLAFEAQLVQRCGAGGGRGGVEGGCLLLEMLSEHVTSNSPGMTPYPA